jgi:hypothetical protein
LLIAIVVTARKSSPENVWGGHVKFWFRLYYIIIGLWCKQLTSRGRPALLFQWTTAQPWLWIQSIQDETELIPSVWAQHSIVFRDRVIMLSNVWFPVSDIYWLVMNRQL